MKLGLAIVVHVFVLWLCSMIHLDELSLVLKLLIVTGGLTTLGSLGALLAICITPAERPQSNISSVKVHLRLVK